MTENSITASDIKKSLLYKGYIKSKHKSIFNKICDLVMICRSTGVENDLYCLLDLLWTKNIDSVVLLYMLEGDSDTNLFLAQDQTMNNDTKYDPDKILKKIRIEIDYLSSNRAIPDSDF